MGRPASAAPPGRGAGPLVGWIVAGVLGLALVALVAFQFGRSSAPDRVAPSVSVTVTVPLVVPGVQVETTTTTTTTEVAPEAAPEATPESTPQRAPTPPAESLSYETEFAVPRPPALELASAPTAAPAIAETLRQKMTRCLSFKVEDDEIHGVSMPFSTQTLVTVTNRCDFSFAGAEVWFEARAIPNRGTGTSAREVGRFQNPVEAKSSSETRMILSCPRCYAASHTLEGRLWWASGGGRTE